jgi:hypothetical protein
MDCRRYGAHHAPPDRVVRERTAHLRARNCKESDAGSQRIDRIGATRLSGLQFAVALPSLTVSLVYLLRRASQPSDTHHGDDRADGRRAPGALDAEGNAVSAGRCAAITLALCAVLTASAQAETAVLLPASGDEALREEQSEAVRVLSRALETQGIRLLEYDEAIEQAGARDVSRCKTVDCAPKLLRAVGADVAASLAVWSRGPKQQKTVFVTLVDRQGDRYPGRADVDGTNFGGAAKDALIDARALQLLGPGPWLRVRTKPDGAQVLIGGKLVGATPYRAHVSSGRHVLEVRAEGRESHVQTVDIPPNTAKQIEVEVALKPSNNTADAPDETAGALDGDFRELPVERSRPIVGPILLGAVGVGLIATDIVLIASSGCSEEDSSGACKEEGKVDTAMAVAWGAAGAAALAGGILWYVLGASDEPASSTRARPALAFELTPNRVALSGSF